MNAPLVPLHNQNLKLCVLAQHGGTSTPDVQSLRLAFC